MNSVDDANNVVRDCMPEQRLLKFVPPCKRKPVREEELCLAMTIFALKVEKIASDFGFFDDSVFSVGKLHNTPLFC